MEVFDAFGGWSDRIACDNDSVHRIHGRSVGLLKSWRISMENPKGGSKNVLSAIGLQALFLFEFTGFVSILE
jgi:hypothetical protein